SPQFSSSASMGKESKTLLIPLELIMLTASHLHPAAPCVEKALSLSSIRFKMLVYSAAYEHETFGKAHGEETCQHGIVTLADVLGLSLFMSVKIGISVLPHHMKTRIFNTSCDLVILGATHEGPQGMMLLPVWLYFAAVEGSWGSRTRCFSDRVTKAQPYVKQEVASSSFPIGEAALPSRRLEHDEIL
ncbi:hypothetical protein STEG23_009915, partial [Scotinomys teguina]